MKIVLFSRQRVSHSPSDLRLLFTEIELRGFDWAVNEEFAPLLMESIGLAVPSSKLYGGDVGDQPAGTVMICIGGDGTLLEGVHRLSGREIVVVGINSGRLGFLTCVSRSGTTELFDSLERGELRVESRSMLEVCGGFSAGEWLMAANEFSVQRQGASMISVEARVDGEGVATYHGDGVIVATPTGSTAYSLSVGGAVVSPQCACWIISPIAPHNITMRPVLIPDSSVVEMSIKMREGDAAISLDNRTYPIGSGDEVTLRRARCNFYLGLNSNISFYETLRDKMMWGVDVRD